MHLQFLAPLCGPLGQDIRWPHDNSVSHMTHIKSTGNTHGSVDPTNSGSSGCFWYSLSNPADVGLLQCQLNDSLDISLCVSQLPALLRFPKSSHEAEVELKPVLIFEHSEWQQLSQGNVIPILSPPFMHSLYLYLWFCWESPGPRSRSPLFLF